MMISNIYSGIPAKLGTELFEDIIGSGPFRLERIVSMGHSTPEGCWYDQDKDEWVMLLKGGARLMIEDEDEPVMLWPGDHLNIPAHTRHRVDWTDPHGETVWLALHY